MSLTASHRFGWNHGTGTVLLRLILYQGELYRLPVARQGIRVVSGKAWITLAGQDITLTSGERTLLAPKNDFALVSALGDKPLILEVFGDARSKPSARLQMLAL